MESINDRLKQLRESLGLSQAAFGQKIGLERSSMSAIEHNQRKLTPRSIRDVCREYNVSEEWLTTGSGEMFCEDTAHLTQGERIRFLRKNLGLTQTQFGEKVSLKQAVIGQIENDQRSATPRFIRDVCREYNVNEEWLTTGSGEMFREQTVCSTQGERIRFLRKSLGLTQTQFGEKVALKQAVIGQIENNQSAATPRFIRDVCRECNVNEEWLTTGSGEMFREETDVDAIAAIDRIMYGENEFAKSVFRAFASLGEEEWKVIEKLIDQIKQTPGI